MRRLAPLLGLLLWATPLLAQEEDVLPPDRVPESVSFAQYAVIGLVALLALVILGKIAIARADAAEAEGSES